MNGYLKDLMLIDSETPYIKRTLPVIFDRDFKIKSLIQSNEFSELSNLKRPFGKLNNIGAAIKRAFLN